MLNLFKNDEKTTTSRMVLYNIKKKLLKSDEMLFSVITTNFMFDDISDFRITLNYPPNYIYFFVKKFLRIGRFNRISFGRLNKSESLKDHYENLLSENDETELHVLLKGKKIPKSYNRWDINQFDGINMAHVAARYGVLPDDFDQWRIRDNDGRSVAHVAAEYQTLPPNFNSWNLTDNNGVRVFDIYREIKQAEKDTEK